jgi:hypothetical protein
MIASIVGGAIGLLTLLVGAVLSLAGFVFWLWMLIHAITNNGIAGAEKVVWVLVIIFLPFIGSIIYFFAGRPKGSAAVRL